MSEYRTIVCDRCGAEKRRENSDSWAGWHEAAEVRCTDVVRLYSGWPDFGWSGTLCSKCAGEIDEGVRDLFRFPPLPTKENQE